MAKANNARASSAYVNALTRRYARDIQAQVGSAVPSIPYAPVQRRGLIDQGDAVKQIGQLDKPGTSNQNIVQKGFATAIDSLEDVGNQVVGGLPIGTMIRSMGKRVFENPVTQTIIDQLASLGYTSSQTGVEAANVIRGATGNEANDAQREAGAAFRANPLKTIKDVVNLPQNYMQAMSSERKNTGVDVFDAITGNNPDSKVKIGPVGYEDIRAIAGLGWDIASDPLTYVTGAGLLKAGRVGSMTARGSELAATSNQSLRQAARAEATALAKKTGNRETFKSPSTGAQVQDFGTRYVNNWKRTASWRRSKNKSAPRTAGRVMDFSKGTRAPDRAVPVPEGTVVPEAAPGATTSAVQGAERVYTMPAGPTGRAAGAAGDLLEIEAPKVFEAGKPVVTQVGSKVDELLKTVDDLEAAKIIKKAELTTAQKGRQAIGERVPAPFIQATEPMVRTSLTPETKALVEQFLKANPSAGTITAIESLVAKGDTAILDNIAEIVAPKIAMSADESAGFISVRLTTGKRVPVNIEDARVLDKIADSSELNTPELFDILERNGLDAVPASKMNEVLRRVSQGVDEFVEPAEAIAGFRERMTFEEAIEVAQAPKVVSGKARNAWGAKIRRLQQSGAITKTEAIRLRDVKTPEEYQAVIDEIRNSEFNPLDEFSLNTGVELPTAEVAVLAEEAIKPGITKITEELARPDNIVDGVNISEIGRNAYNRVYDKLVNPKTVKDTHPHLTNTGVHKTDSRYMHGSALHRTSWNAPNQAQAFTGVIHSIRKASEDLFPKPKRSEFPTKEDYFDARDAALTSQNNWSLRQAAAALREVEEMAMSRGANIVIGNEAIGKGAPMRLSQILDSLSSTQPIRTLLSDRRTTVNLGNLMEAVNVGIRGVDLTPEGLKNLIGQALRESKFKTIEDLSMTNKMLDPDPSYINKVSRFAKVSGKDAVVARSIDKLSNAIIAQLPKLRQLHKYNVAEFSIRTEAQTKGLTKEVTETLDRSLNGTDAGTADVIDQIVNQPTIIAESADAMGATGLARARATRNAAETSTQIMQPEVVADAERMSNMITLMERTKGQDANAMHHARAKDHDRLVAEEQAARNPEDYFDLGDNIEMAMDKSVFGRWLDRTRSRFQNTFAAHAGANPAPGMGDAVPQARNNIRPLIMEMFSHLDESQHFFGKRPKLSNGELGVSQFNRIGEHIHAGGNKSTLPLELHAAYDAVQPHYEFFFSTNAAGLGRQAYGNHLFSNGIGIKAFNDAAVRRGINMQYDMKAAQTGVSSAARAEIKTAAQQKITRQMGMRARPSKNAAGFKVWQKWKARYDKKLDAEINARVAEIEANSPNMLDRLASQWRGWDVKGGDYGQFLADYTAIMSDVIVSSSAADELMRIGRSVNAVSSKPIVGFVKIAPNGHLGVHMPSDVFVSSEFATGMRRAEKMLADQFEPGGAKTDFVNNVLAPYLDLWKAGMTIYRPGHHARNIVGDTFMTYSATGVLSLRDGVDGLRIAAVRQRVNWDEIVKALNDPDFMARAQNRDYNYVNALDGIRGRRDVLQTPNDGTVIRTVTLANGEKIPLSAGQINDAFLNRGSLPSVAQRENLVTENAFDGGTVTGAKRHQQAKDWLAKVSPLHGKGRKVAVVTSEVRDHASRLAHGLAYIKKEGKNYADLNKLFDDAAADVRKWHPDGSGLTRAEQSVIRQLYPFYSWTRKAVPLVFESMILHPARFTMFPKAAYAFAESNGIDLQSFGEPFPADQLFPSFLHERGLGAMWQNADGEYMGINPGIPGIDILGQFGGDAPNTGIIESGPVRGLMSSLSPFIKTLPELISGTSLGTGGRISDYSDYVDSQIPGITQVNALTGISPTSPIDNAFGNENDLGSIEGWTNRQVNRENRDRFSQRHMLNLLLGAGLTNMSQPNYINLAEIEERTRANRN